MPPTVESKVAHPGTFRVTMRDTMIFMRPYQRKADRIKDEQSLYMVIYGDGQASDITCRRQEINRSAGLPLSGRRNFRDWPFLGSSCRAYG